MTAYYYTALVVMTVIGSAASLFLKKASTAENLLETIKNINFYIGGFLYLTSALLNIWVLRYLEYSVVLPLTALTYVWTMLFSHLILKEQITVGKICGVVFILIGGICISV